MATVTAAKPKTGGALHVGATTATLPTTTDATLTGFTSLGNSIAMVRKLIESWPFDETATQMAAAATPALAPDTFVLSLVEGWRGEICHTAITDASGKLALYKVKDPSFHNWRMLELAVRNNEISDFPICNKSFNLSYCGHDL